MEATPPFWYEKATHGNLLNGTAQLALQIDRRVPGYVEGYVRRFWQVG